MKRRLLIWLLGIFLLLVGAVVWVRHAPSDPAHWHRMPDDVQAGDLGTGAIRILEPAENKLARLDAIIRKTPRTRVVAGTIGDAMITYVTRTAWVGFPDYTTIRKQDDRVEIFGRARYGLSDLGVNAARIDGWLDALAQGG